MVLPLLMSPAGAVLPAACGAAMMGLSEKSVRTFAADGVVSSAIMKVTIAEILLDRGLEVSTT